MENIPYDCRIIGVEMTENAEFLNAFEHPKRAIYLLGAEDEGLPKEILERCHFTVKLPGNNSLNVAIAGSIVAHDRAAKLPSKLPVYHKE